MFRTTTANYLSWSVQNVHKWKSVPIRWDESTGNILVVRTKLRILLWYLTILTFLIAYGNIMVQVVRMNLLEDSIPPAVKTFTEFFIYYHAIPLSIHLALLSDLDKLVYLCNSYRKFYSELQRTSFCKEASVGRICDLFLTFIMYSGQAISVTFMLIMLRFPVRPDLITHLFLSKDDYRWYELLPFVLFYAFENWSAWSLLYFISFHEVAYVFATVSTLKTVKKHSVQTRPDLWRLAMRSGFERVALRANVKIKQVEFSKLWRSLSVLQRIFFHSFGLILSSHSILFILLIIRAIYGALVLHGEVRIMLAIIGVCAWIYLQIIYRFLAEIYEASRRAVVAWSSTISDPWFRRFHHSCQVLKVEVGSLFFVDRGMPLTLAMSISDSIVNMLVAHQRGW